MAHPTSWLQNLRTVCPLGKLFHFIRGFFSSSKPRILMLIQLVRGLWGRRWIAQSAQGPSAISKVEWHAGMRTNAHTMMSWESHWPGLRSGWAHALTRDHRQLVSQHRPPWASWAVGLVNPDMVLNPKSQGRDRKKTLKTLTNRNTEKGQRGSRPWFYYWDLI